MTNIQIKTDCGNSPRKIFLAKLNTAFAKGDTSILAEILPSDITLEIIGLTKVQGKENVMFELLKGPFWKTKILRIDTIITHGRDASVNGQIVLQDDSMYSFCDIYSFKGASGTIIKDLVRFIIKSKTY